MNGTDRNRTRRDPSKNLAKVDKRPLWGILANFQFFLESLLSKSLRGMLSVAPSCLLLPKDLIDRLDPPLANPANLMRPAMSLFYPLTMNPAFYSKNPRLGLSLKPPHILWLTTAAAPIYRFIGNRQYNIRHFLELLSFFSKIKRTNRKPP